MKIIFERANKVAKSDTAPSDKPSYIVAKKSNSVIKNVLLVIAVLIGGFAGGYTFNFFSNQTSNQSSANKNNSNIVSTKYEFETVENPVVAIAEKVSQSVVGIKVEYTAQSVWGMLTQSEGEGSGTIYSDDGYIITNYHVIEQAVTSSNASIYVTIAGVSEELPAKIIGYDKQTDIAVIKIDKTGLTAAEFGSSTDMKVGALAVAIGNPLGSQLAGTVTGGYISALNRSITIDNVEYNLIQTDAAINAGNSGGALVDVTGKVIGINTAKISATGVEGIGFAIPIDSVLPIVEELITNKTVVRPFIGVFGMELSESVAKRYSLVEGIYIQEVVKDSPAQLAKIEQGDVIVEAQGEKVKNISELNVIKNKLKVGDTITLKIYSNKEYKTVKVVLASSADFDE